METCITLCLSELGILCIYDFCSCRAFAILIEVGALVQFGLGQTLLREHRQISFLLVGIDTGKIFVSLGFAIISAVEFPCNYRFISGQ